MTITSNIGLILEWLTFFCLMGIGLYTMWVIKNEKKNYLKNAKKIVFKKFVLLVPQWWGEVPTGSIDEISFQRLDTRYEWEARFIWSDSPNNQDVIELFKEKIIERKILFDTESSVIHNPDDFAQRDLIKTGIFEMVRLEGTATADRETRLYYDAFLIRNLETGQYLYAESRSSVLNGLVEGPYFEEVILRMTSL